MSNSKFENNLELVDVNNVNIGLAGGRNLSDSHSGLVQRGSVKVPFLR